jgi:hypothetical protein
MKDLQSSEAALGTAATQIESGIERWQDGEAKIEEAKQVWIEGILETAEGLAAARSAFPDNKAFGKWCTANFGENRLNRNDRAALIDFASDLEWTREVLEKTERISIQTIHSREWKRRVPNPRKTREPKAGGPKAKIVGLEAENDQPQTLLLEGPTTANKAIFTREEFNKICFCLSPDRKNTVTFEDLREAIELFLDRKELLTLNDRPDDFTASSEKVKP